MNFFPVYFITKKILYKKYKTGASNDPLGPIFSPENCFVLRNFEKWGQTDDKCVKILITHRVDPFYMSYAAGSKTATDSISIP